MDADVTPRLHAEGVAFDAEDAALLRSVAEEGSLHAAASALDRSYSRAHKRVAAIEEAFGPLVERRRGGPEGGGSELTPTAEELLARFERLRAVATGSVETEKTVVPGTVVDRTGELGTVETAAGHLRALVPPDADRVAVSVRADAVTLHAPGESPAPDDTSARNRLEGTVARVDVGEAVATVTVEVGGDTSLAALVTVDSAGRLGLEPGVPVVATFKATATRAIPVE